MSFMSSERDRRRSRQVGGGGIVLEGIRSLITSAKLLGILYALFSIWTEVLIVIHFRSHRKSFVL